MNTPSSAAISFPPRRWVVFALLAAALVGNDAAHGETGIPKRGYAMSLTLTSPSFHADEAIPSRHTCDGQDISPALSWGGLPESAKSLVLIVDDPDAPDPAAPQRTWVHWVLYNLPPTAAGLPEGAAAGSLPAGTLQGTNDWQRTGYGGPCPPIGTHRYFHKLYALDTVLPDLDHPTKAMLEKAMLGHILGKVELVGKYQKKR